MSRFSLVGLFLLVALGQTAQASDIYIKGTQVSYSLDINDKKVNNSSVYVDEANDTSNKNYATFSCEDGAAIFYLSSAQKLYTQKQYDDGTIPDMQVVVDGGRPITFITTSTRQEGKRDFNSLALDDKFDAQMLRLFQSAQKSVVINLPLPDKKAAKFTFYPKGFAQAFSKVNLCQ